MLFKSKVKENKLLKIAGLVTFGIAVAVNALANILPINGVNSGQVSDSYPNLFAPIGFTFSIWSIIYLLLLGFCVYQFSKVRNKKSKLKEDTLNKILPFFIASSVLNSIWIFTWHFQKIGIAVVVITAILVCLARIASELKKAQFTGLDQLLVKTPFSIYFGWITVATIANITTWLVSINWNGLNFSDTFWVSAVLVIGVVIGFIKSERNNDPVYLAVFAWAYFGILAKHIAQSGFNEQYPTVVGLLVILLGAIFYKLYTFRKTIKEYF